MDDDCDDSYGFDDDDDRDHDDAILGSAHSTTSGRSSTGSRRRSSTTAAMLIASAADAGGVAGTKSTSPTRRRRRSGTLKKQSLGVAPASPSSPLTLPSVAALRMSPSPRQRNRKKLPALPSSATAAAATTTTTPPATLQHHSSTGSMDSSTSSLDFAPSLPLRSSSPSAAANISSRHSRHSPHPQRGDKNEEEVGGDDSAQDRRRRRSQVPQAPSSKDAKQQQGFWNMLAAATTTMHRSATAAKSMKFKTSSSRGGQRRVDVATDKSRLLYLEGSSNHLNYSYDDDDDGGNQGGSSDIDNDEEYGGGGGDGDDTLLPTTYISPKTMMLDGHHSTSNTNDDRKNLHQRSSVHHGVGGVGVEDLRWGNGSTTFGDRDDYVSCVAGTGPTITAAAGGIIDDRRPGSQANNRRLSQSRHAMPPQKPSRTKKPVISAFSCMPTNTLLIGGQYYPGKDKRRSRHYYNSGMKHTLLRAFCGTPTRQTISLIIVAYFLVYWLIIPIGEYFMFGSSDTHAVERYEDMMGRPHHHYGTGTGGSGGRQAGRPSYGDRLFFDSGEGVLERLSFDGSVFVNLPSLQEELKSSHAMYDARRNVLTLKSTSIEDGSTTTIYSERLKLLESIVPDWYHRFDDVDANAALDNGEKASGGGKDSADATNGTKTYRASSTTKKSATETKSTQHLHSKHRAKTADGSWVERTKTDLAAKNSSAVSSPENTTKFDSKSDSGATDDAKSGNNNTLPSRGSIGDKIKGNDDHQRDQAPESSTAKRRTLQQIGGIADASDDGRSSRLPIRTIHNMNELGMKHSSCGRLSDGEQLEGGPNKFPVTSDPKTSLVVQTSLNRLWILNETCKRWSNDPIVAVVFVPYDDHKQRVDNNETQQQRHLINHADSLNCTNVQLVKYLASAEESQLGRYPVNRLRNVALDLVTTTHVLVVDVDFVPSQDLDLLIRRSIIYQQEQSKKQSDEPDGHRHRRMALVVPAFEKHAPNCSTDEECVSYLKGNSSFLPRTFDELVNCYKSEAEDCIVFQSDNNWEGHSTTRSELWLRKEWYEKEHIDQLQGENGHGPQYNEKKNLPFREITCFDTARYEPYLVLEWCPNQEGSPPLSPYYDERFYGYGKNKIELVSHIRYRGDRLSVLPEGFIIHNPHRESPTKQTWNDRHQDLHSEMDSLYSKFLKELRIMYSENAQSKNGTIQLCVRPNH